jgi:hypothetical protein
MLSDGRPFRRSTLGLCHAEVSTTPDRMIYGRVAQARSTPRAQVAGCSWTRIIQLSSSFV